MIRRPVRWLTGLATVSLAASCAVYEFKDIDGRTLAAKGRRGLVMNVQTAADTVSFSDKDPVEIKSGAVLGSVRNVYTFDPLDISAVIPGRPRPTLVLRDGSRFQIAASRRVEERIRCETVKPIAVPLDEVVRAKIRVVKVGRSILRTIGKTVVAVGALAVDIATFDTQNLEPGTTFTEDIVSALIDSAAEAPAGSGLQRSNKALLGMASAPGAAGETEFWTREWAAVEAQPGEDGKLRLRLEDPSGVPRGIDEAKLVIIDHIPGLAPAPDTFGTVRACQVLVPPGEAVDSSGKDVKELVSAKDHDFWRSPLAGPSPDPQARARDRLTLWFPRPKGASRAKLIISAATSFWPAELAREAPPAAAKSPAGAKPPQTYQPWEYGGLRVELETCYGWRTAQVILAPGPLPDFDLVYDLELSDVLGDKVRIKLAPPAGYWLIDRLALDFSPDVSLEPAEVAAESVDGPDGPEVLAALVSVDSHTLRLAPGDPPALVTFPLPPMKDGMERTVFLRTINCYEVPGGVAKKDGSKRGRP